MAAKDKRFEHLLNPIRDLAQNWNIDVAKDLEDYLEELEHIQVSFDGGKTSLNFAEAALLIQGSACIYSRKVEYLYTLIYQALDMVHAQAKKPKKSLDATDLDAQALEEEADEEFLLLDDVITEGKNIDMPEKPDEMAMFLDMTMNYTGGNSATPNQKRVAAALLAKTPLSAFAASRFERRDGKEFRILGSYISKNGALMLNSSSFNTKSLLDVGISRPDASSVNATHIIPQDNTQQPQTHDVLMGSSPGGGDDNDGGDYYFDGDYDYAVPPPADEPAAAMPQRAARSNRQTQQQKTPSVDAWAQLDPNADTGAASHRPLRKGRTYIVLKNAKLVSSVGPMFAAAQAMSAAAADGGRGSREAKAILARAEAIQQKARLAKSGMPQAGGKSSNYNAFAFTVASLQRSDSTQRVAAPLLPEDLMSTDRAKAAITNPSPLFPELDRLYSRIKQENARLRLAARRAKAQTDPVYAATGGAYADAESDDDNSPADNYNYDNNNNHHPYEAGAGDVDYGGDYDMGAPPDFDAAGKPAEHWLDDVAAVKHKESTMDAPFSLAMAGGMGSAAEDEDEAAYARLVEDHMRRIDQYIQGSGMYANESALTRRVTEWQDKLLPVLEEEDQREEFDINEYGRRIISQLSELTIEGSKDDDDVADANAKNVVDFKQAVSSNERYYVCRSFLATLQLANFGNVDIVPNQPVSTTAGVRTGKVSSKDISSSFEVQEVATGFSVRLLNTQLPVDAADHYDAVNDDAAVAASSVHATSARVSGVSGQNDKREAASKAGATKKRPLAGASSNPRGKRAAKSGTKYVSEDLEHSSDDDDNEGKHAVSDEDGENKVPSRTTAATSPLPSSKRSSSTAHLAKGKDDEMAPPTPYKPGELYSPLSKKARADDEGGVKSRPLTALPLHTQNTQAASGGVGITGGVGVIAGKKSSAVVAAYGADDVENAGGKRKHPRSRRAVIETA